MDETRPPILPYRFDRAASGHVASIPRRALGRTGYVLPVLGLDISQTARSAVSSPHSIPPLVTGAVEEGVEVFATSLIGDQSQQFGSALKAIRMEKHAFIMASHTHFDDEENVSIDALRRQLDVSLEHLPHINVLVLKAASGVDFPSNFLSALDKLRSEGLFKHIGILGRGTELDSAIQTDAFDILVAPAHKALSPRELDRLERARASGLGVVGVEILSPTAKRFRWSLRPHDLWHNMRQFLRKSLDQRPETTFSVEECLQWVLNSGLVDVALIQATRPAQLTQNIAIARSTS